MEKVSILSMFRDSEDYIFDALNRLEKLEQSTSNCVFEYYFYENDSVDNTVNILDKWLRNRTGEIKSEKLGKPKFSQSTSVQRQIDMTDYRNRMLNIKSPLESNYTLILDSDVIYDEQLINNYLEYFDDDVVMVTPNVLQNIKCKMFDPTKDSYYDSFALIDLEDNHGMTWTSNPFIRTEDRQRWGEGLPIHVSSAFGGCPLIKTEVLNRVRWSTDGGCEHWNFCKQISTYGKIIVTPKIIVKVNISEGIINSIANSHINNVIKFQRQKLNDQYIFK
tara:strand:+ start:1262 stop:2092 length:831 start_codon:yes stop_codon:yes gene_type:complete